MRKLDINKNYMLMLISRFFRREYLVAIFILSFILLISFNNIFFFNKTLLTSSYAPGVMSNGPYINMGKQFSSIPVIDFRASAAQYEPELYLTSLIYKSGNLPLWNPYIASGLPLAADMISSAFYPFNILIFIVPIKYIWLAMDFTLIFRLILAGFFTYCFAREINISMKGSIVSACSFMLTGYLILYINQSHLNVEVLVPMLLYFMERLSRYRDIKYCIYSSFVVALSIFGGMPESALFSFFFVALYYLLRTYMVYRIDIGEILKSILYLFFTYSLGILLSAILTIPFIEYMMNSWNLHNDKIGMQSLTFNFDTISLVIPYFHGPIWNTWDGSNQFGIMPYIGIITAFFSILAIYNKNKRRFVLFFFGFCAFYMLKAYGAPIINSIGSLPLFDISIFYKYCFPEFALSMAILAGIGFEVLPSISFKKSMVSFSILSILICIFSVKNILNAKSKDLLTLSNLSWIFLSLGEALIILFVLFFALFLLYRLPRFNKSINLFLMVLLVLELMIYIPSGRPDRINPYESAPYIGFLKDDHSIFRIIGLEGILFPNIASAFEIFDVREVLPLNIERYKTFILETVDKNDKRFHAINLPITDENVKTLSFMNVKYILSNSYLSLKGFNGENIIDNILEKSQILSEKGYPVSKRTFDGREVLYQYPTSTINYPFMVPKGPVSLNFSIGLNSQVWSPDKGDGVRFEIVVDDAGVKNKIFSQYIDPKNNLTDRRFYQEDINLTKYSEKNIKLIFMTSQGSTNRYDWAWWGDINLKTSDIGNRYFNLENRLKLVYDKEIKIYENKDVLPRAFIVHDAEIEGSKSELFDKIKGVGFDFKKSVVLDRELNKISDLSDDNDNSSSVESECRIVFYHPNEVKLIANATTSGLLVISDAYYPGWRVYVDGQEKKILVANYAFKAVQLERGTHSVEFIYDPISFRVGYWLSSLVFLAIIGYLLRNRISRCIHH